jgi:hypothetical protein
LEKCEENYLGEKKYREKRIRMIINATQWRRTKSNVIRRK